MLGAALLTTLLAAPPAVTRLGILCSGPASSCAVLEAGMAGKLAAPTIAVVPSTELAKALATPAIEPKAISQEKGLLDQAESSYYHANWAEARARIDEAEKIQAGEPLAAGDAPRLFVLRGALSLKAGMKEKAAADIKAAVELDPDYDAGSFPPAVQSLVEKAKGDLPTQAILKVKASPAEAVVTLDGRAVSGQISVVPGAHTLVARAPGYSTLVMRGLKVAEDQSLKVDLPVAPPAPLAAAVSAWLAGGDASVPLKSFSEVAGQAKADGLLILVPEAGDKGRAVLFAGGRATASAALPLAKITEWVAKGLVSATPSAITPTPTPTAVAIAPTPTPTPRELAAVGAGAAGATLVPHPQTNPAVAPPVVQQSRPLTKRPVFWMAVGGAAVAVVGAALLAGAGESGTNQNTKGTGNMTVVFQ